MGQFDGHVNMNEYFLPKYEMWAKEHACSDRESHTISVTHNRAKPRSSCTLVTSLDFGPCVFHCSLSTFYYSFIPWFIACPLPEDSTQNVLLLPQHVKTGRLRTSFTSLTHTTHYVRKKTPPKLRFQELPVSFLELRKPKMYIIHRPRNVSETF